MTADLAFSPDPWLWRRQTGGSVLHAIRDDEWLGERWGIALEAACGELGIYPLGDRYAVARRCKRCTKRLEAGGDA